MKDHPGDFLTKLGYDIYLNPWWGVRTARSQGLVQEMDRVLGPADLWFHGGMFHELLWGPRDLPREWRPGFSVNLSGTNSKVWRSFWLPWRMRNFWYPRGNGRAASMTPPNRPNPDEPWNAENPPLPYAANTQDENVLPGDIPYVEKYNAAIPMIRQYLATGKVCGLLKEGL